MVIGIIGSSLSGLVAGKKLAQSGHDVTIIEKGHNLGGKLASFTHNNTFFDYGISSIISSNRKFEKFMSELKAQNLIKEWAQDFAFFDGTQFHEVNPNRPKNVYHAGTKGLAGIATYLSRWIDIKSEAEAGGLTHIGADRSKKKSWMINLTDSSVFECDAVILATPAPIAYGILQIAQDETPSKRIIRHIDEIEYEPCYSLMAAYNQNKPVWKGIECDNSILAWLGNETSKQNDGEANGTSLVIRSSASFVDRYYDASYEIIKDALLQEAVDIAGAWISSPQWSQLHFWKYYKAKNPIQDYFLEMEMNEAPLALIGDYYKGNTVQDAYLSGLNLAEYWINKFSNKTLSK